MNDTPSTRGKPRQTTVLVCDGVDFFPDDALIASLRTRFPQVRFIAGSPDSLEDRLRSGDFAETDADVFFGFPHTLDLRRFPHLRWIQVPSAGAPHRVDHPDAFNTLQVTTANGVYGEPGAEHAIALLLALARGVHEHVIHTQNRQWKQNASSVELSRSCIGILGLGDLGAETAKRLRPFTPRLIGLRRNPASPCAYVDRVYGPSELGSFLEQCHVLVSCLPSTGETKHLLTREMLGQLKPGALFVNIGRGDAVDEEALADALREGKIAGAGLDVTRIEPLPAESPLWTAPNVIISSHSLNVFHSKNERRVTLFAGNLERYLKGEPLRNAVRPELGY